MTDLTMDKTADEEAAGSKSALMEVVQAMHKLPLEEKAQLLEYLSRALQYGIRREAFQDVSWEEFLDRSFGSLPDFTLDREMYEDVGVE
ncbi:MAG: hypothetical protein OXE46_07575 [Chloroflexi bacterium]|nr:hypothetical protein [Chloroflexota bacterium]